MLGYIEKGKAEGARVVVGGGRPDAVSTRAGSCEPTLFADVDNTMTIAREEIFGPVLVVIPFDDDDDAVRIANDNQYGLGGYVTSGSDGAGARRSASRIRAGTVSINGGVIVRRRRAVRRLQGQRRRSPERHRGLRAVHRGQDLRRRRPGASSVRCESPSSGAGQIGAPMSERLLAAGHELTVYARRAEVREHFARLGAAVTDSLAEAADGAEAVHLALYSDEQLADVTLGEGGLVPAPRAPTPCSCPTPPAPGDDPADRRGRERARGRRAVQRRRRRRARRSSHGDARRRARRRRTCRATRSARTRTRWSRSARSAARSW